jgi:hypothetical protein
MSLARTIWYWHSQKGGPKDAILVYQDGSYREVDLRQSLSEEVRASFGSMVGIGLKGLLDGKWSVEFQVGHKKYSSIELCNNVSEVVSTVLAEVKTAQDDEALLKANPEIELERRLQSHDWTYAYSDDHRYWSAGDSNWKRICVLELKVSPEKFQELWKKYAPAEDSIPSV